MSHDFQLPSIATIGDVHLIWFGVWGYHGIAFGKIAQSHVDVHVSGIQGIPLDPKGCYNVSQMQNQAIEKQTQTYGGVLKSRYPQLSLSRHGLPSIKKNIAKPSMVTTGDPQSHMLHGAGL